ncbi:MAG: restriction endonuclease subunit S [Candidatus Brocadia sp.]|uniref:Type I restriction modification DNA specificity domain-containing protein n=1 Tax=Candidatus Brocadia fulgida TaxID=380242 RepID=A0A0M2UQ41_9BACT|nr:MAG: hypothetical protein BROFUL_03313 [Candidatus Brocadia fulgida]UJS21684.1 MAG: restriction endonuclease subunit S [Candidatus Brocadia sp.]
MSEWKEYKFSDFVHINPTLKLSIGETYSFVEMKDLSNGHKFCTPSIERKLTSGSKFQEGDTLFARITPCLENGKICQVRGLKNGVGFGSTEFFVFRGKHDVSDNEFVFYLSRWDEVRSFAEMNFDGTSGRQRVPKESLDNLFLKLPPLSEQKSIASILSSLDDKIDLLHRQNKTLEALAETLFRQWFVEENESLEIAKLKDFCNHLKANVNPLKQPDKIFHHYSIPAFDEGQEPEITPGREIRSNKYQIKEGTILISKLNPRFPRVWPILENIGKNHSICSTEFQVVEPKDSKYFGFILCFLKSKAVKDELIQSTSGTSGSHQRVSPEDIFNLTIPVTNDDKLNEFNLITNPYWDKIKNNKRQIRTLIRLRDTLLPKLMNREVRVKELDLLT